LKSIIPNSLTALNLLCGCISVLAFLGEEHFAGIMLILIAALADFLDGFVARLLKVQSELGKQLDSLADMVSFGFVPGVIVFKSLVGSNPLNNNYLEELNSQNYLPLFGFLITIFSGVRLAKFNIDTRQSNSFIGLPTPANTLFFLTIPLIWINEIPGNWAYELTLNKPLIVCLVALFSYLLVAELPLLALKFKGFRLKENIYRYSLLVLGISGAVLLKHLSIPIILIIYLMLSVLENNYKSRILREKKIK
jgi:CDP-diacylglycerol--serine O-phosphatidyltransferase